MAEFALPKNSRPKAGKVWPAEGGAKKPRRFRIYRHEPEDGTNPRIDTFELDLDESDLDELRAYFEGNEIELVEEVDPAMAAAEVAQRLGAKFLVTFTHSGDSARRLARLRSEIPILASLGVIVGTLAITTVASLAKSRKDDAAAAAAARSTPSTTPEDGDDPAKEVPETSGKSAG